MKRIAVIDMDGCLCSVNSFRVWVIYSMLWCLLVVRWGKMLRIFWSMMVRVAGSCDRVEMKRRVLRDTEGLSDRAIGYFVRILRIYTNTEVLRIGREYQDAGVVPVVVTAAPCCYAQAYVEASGITELLCTRSVFTDNWVENVGAEKVKSVSSRFGQDCTVECVLSDHHDDLPLMRISKNVILVNPDDVTVEILAGSVEYRII